jgi:hypothetical protein
MKNVCLLLLCVIAVACGCNTGNSFPAADNAFDAGREFIDGCLKGDFNKAGFYMLNDTDNSNDLLKVKRDYNAKSVEQKHEYAAASIIIQEEETVTDSVHIIHYMNSYDRIARKVKVILRNNTWQVDFKYTFNGNL